MGLGDVYEAVYQRLSGKGTTLYPWHFQWHALLQTHQWQSKQMALLQGNILDVGCGDKPYKSWLKPKQITTYVGIDVVPGEDVDHVVEEGKPWPFKDKTFDGAIMTQVLEHVVNPKFVISELGRTLRLGGTIILTVPFLYPIHGAPHDYYRYTPFSLRALFSEHFRIQEIVTRGRFGSTLAVLLLTWVENSFNLTFLGRISKGLLLPVWIVFCGLVNLVGSLVNFLDRTESHYGNTCLIAVRK